LAFLLNFEVINKEKVRERSVKKTNFNFVTAVKWINNIFLQKMPRKYERKSDMAKWTEVNLQTARELVQNSGWSPEDLGRFESLT
jgi:hypothetical protein